MSNIDPIDLRIMRNLQRDASLPLEELGQAVGLSRNACWRRIRAMEDAGIIRGKVALLDPEKLGLGLQVFIQVRTTDHTADWLSRFATETRAMPEITGVYRMSGELDYLIRARVADVAGYDHLYRDLIARIPLADVSASFVMEEIKDTSELPV